MQDDKINTAYYRLSLADGDVVADDEAGKHESCSISSQRKCITEYAKQHIDPDCNLVEFIDDGYTGTNFNRPGFQKLLFEIMKGRVRTLIIKDLSRLGRDYLDVGYYLERIFPLYKVRVILVNDGYDSGKMGETTAGLDIATKNLINEWYSRDISTKIKSVVDMKKYAGEYVFGAVPYGYKKGEKKNTIVADPAAAEVVRRIFSLACQGNTISRIAQILNAEKVMTPSVYLKLAGIRKNYKTREFWTYESIRNILENRIYTGDSEAFKSHVRRVGSNQVKQIPLEQRTVIENTHEAIISREEFFSARDVVKSNKKRKGAPSQEVLTGYLVCGCCGNKMSNGKKQNRFYYCSSARYLPGGDCDKVKVSKERMKEIVYHAIKMQIDITDLHMKQREKLLGTSASKARENSKKQKSAKTRLNKSKDEVMSLYEDYVSGIVSKEEFLEEKKRLTDEQDQLIQSIRQLENDAKVITLDSQNSDQEMERLRFKSSTELNAEMMRAFVKRVTVMPDQSINIEWNFKMDDSITSLLHEDEETG